MAGSPGAPVVAPADGVVILAADRPFTLEGNLLMIDHGHGLNSAFLHLSRIDVIPGQHVVQGQRIGAIGATARATGPHLHRSEERRVGNECVSKCRYWWSQDHKNKKKAKTHKR